MIDNLFFHSLAKKLKKSFPLLQHAASPKIAFSTVSVFTENNPTLITSYSCQMECFENNIFPAYCTLQLLSAHQSWKTTICVILIILFVLNRTPHPRMSMLHI